MVQMGVHGRIINQKCTFMRQSRVHGQIIDQNLIYGVGNSQIA